MQRIGSFGALKRSVARNMGKCNEELGDKVQNRIGKGGGEIRMLEKPIKNAKELEFVIFCIENIAIKLGVNAERVYEAFTKKSNILNDYIVPEYEILHTQSKEYIVNDILDVMREREVIL